MHPPLSLIAILFYCVANGCVWSAGITYYMILHQANAREQETGQKFSAWSRNPVHFIRLLRTHRALFPDSRLRLIHILATTGVLILAVLVVALETSGHLR
jgi:hypothetical protein